MKLRYFFLAVAATLLLLFNVDFYAFLEQFVYFYSLIE